MKKHQKIRVPIYKRILYGIIAVVMFGIPFYYYENLKQTPNIGFNNTEINLFVYVAVSFFSLFFVLGIISTAFAIKKREKQRILIQKNAWIKALEIITTALIGFLLGMFIKFYSVIVFFLLVPTVALFFIYVVQIIKKITHKKMIVTTSVICLISFSLTLLFSYLLLAGSFQHNQQTKFLTEFLKESEVIYNKYGGWDNYPSELGTFEATGYFHLTKQNGKHWFVDPEGKPFISKGVNHVNVDSNLAYKEFAMNKYSTKENWATAATQILRKNGYNTITSWSTKEIMDNDMPFTLLCNFGDIFGKKNGWGYYGDYFREDFIEHVDSHAKTIIEPYANSELLLGIFTDNELSWGADWRNIYNHIQLYINFANPSAGKTVLIDFLQNKLENVNAFNQAFGVSINSFNDLYNISPDVLRFNTALSLQLEDEFGGMVAEKYAKITNDALKKYAPNHLNLGCRYALYPGETIVTKIAEHSDLISYAGYADSYHFTFGGKEQMYALYEKLDMPFLIEEYGVRALDTNIPNFLYSGPVVLTQKQRAVTASRYIESFMYQPYAVGFHWFQYTDNNIYGLLNGENYGIVDKEENEYKTFNEMMFLTNNSLELIHLSQEREVKWKSPILWG